MAVVVSEDSIHAVDLTGPTLVEKFSPIPIVDATVYGVAITPDGSKAYVGTGSTGLIVIRLSDFTLTKTISAADLGGAPRFIAVSPTKSEAYVLTHRSGGNLNTNLATTIQPVDPNAPMAAAEAGYLLQVVDTETDTVVGPAAQIPNICNQIAVTPDGSEVYVAMSEGVAYVTVADHLPHTIAGLSDWSIGMAIRSNGATVCTISLNSSEELVLTRIDPHTHTVLAQDPIPSDLFYSEYVAISPDGKTAYVTGFGGQQGNPEALPAATPANIAIMDVSGSGASPTTLYANVDGLLGIAITPDQAPTARFTTSLDNLAVTFDASTSDSPVGTVVLYDWDFGDGQTQSTTSPTISHTYSNGGTYNVTLTVTNSAGTSTEVTFTGQTVSNEGGPSAIHTEAIAVSSPAPTHFQGRVVLHHKHNHKTRRADLKTSWHHSKSTTVKQYEIFARNKRVAKIPVFSNTAKTLRLDPHHFPNHVSKKYRLYLHNKYKIRAVAIDGTASSFTNLKVKH
jgi:PKD repeat protein